MLGQRRERQANINTALAQDTLFPGYIWVSGELGNSTVQRWLIVIFKCHYQIYLLHTEYSYASDSQGCDINC